jgi:uncharacterized protein YkwD
LRSIRTVNAASAAAQFESLGHVLSRHRAITRVSLAALSFTLVIAFSEQSPAQAGPPPAPVIPDSLLPQNIGLAMATDASVTIPFGTPMDADTVADTLQVLPAQDVRLAWNADRSAVTVSPGRLWRADERYLVVVPASTTTAAGTAMGGALRYTFTTEAAPTVSDFQVRLAPADVGAASAPAVEPSQLMVELEGDPEAQAARAADAEPIGAGALSQPPTETAAEVSASSSISIGFSDVMDREDVARHFAIAPEVEGQLSWSGSNLVFTPSERLTPGGRYTVSVFGAHDLRGNVLGGKANFSFTIQAGAQVTKTSPEHDATDVNTGAIEVWFSQPMNVVATAAAFTLRDTTTDAAIPGAVTWNMTHTQLTFTPTNPLTLGHEYDVSVAKSARDLDANPVTFSWTFAMEAPPPAALAAPPPRSAVSTRTAPAIPPPAPATSLAGYALNQVNAARAAYGFAPLVLDASVSAVASAHAWDQARNNYFSHYGLDGSTRETRLARGGVSFGWSGENQCYHIGMSQQATLDWCHAQFMAEPYPGYWNHIANILNPKAHRMGVGIATVGGKTIITWDFTD